MRTLFNINPHSTVNAPFLFREMNSSEKLVVRDFYREFACGRCGKLDEKSAMEKGFPAGMTVKSKRPYIFSAEFIHMVDARARALFVELLSDKLQFFDIPTTGFSAVIARDHYVASEGDPAFRFLNKCKECGRYRELLRGKSVPRIQTEECFVSIYYEGWYGMHEEWLVSKEHASRLKSATPPLTGLVVTPKEVDDGK